MPLASRSTSRVACSRETLYPPRSLRDRIRLHSNRRAEIPSCARAAHTYNAQPMNDPVGHLKRLIRDIPDFPKPGVLFRDITPLLADPQGLALSIELLANPFRGKGIDVVVGAESRGFIFGTAVACAISAGFQVVRKPKKLPFKVVSQSYELEYGTDTLEMHADAISPGQRVLIVDDVLATGGTMRACVDLVKQLGGDIAGVAVMIELEFLKGRSKIPGINTHSVLTY